MGESGKEAYWLGFDLGGTKMQATVFNHEFRVVGRQRKKTKGQVGARAVLERMIDTIKEALSEAEITPEQLGAIGVGVPGPVDQEKGIVHEAVNLGWKKVKLADALEKTFRCPASVVNDVDAGVYAESRFGSAKSAHTVVGVFPGTGIGAGCVYRGQILHGKGISCMELGHVQVTTGGRLCGCGLRGCLETEASRLAISAEAAMAAYRGEAPFLLTAAGTDLANIRSSILAKSIAAGDAAVEKVVRRAAARIGVAIAGVIHLLAPDCVVLGGGLVEAMPELFVGAVSESANTHVMPSFRDTFRTVAAKLGDEASTLGAAAWAALNANRSLAESTR